jgi:hypothetical protein
LATSGPEIQQAKRHSWIPQSPEIISIVDNVVKQMPSEQNGLPLLGSAAQGDFETFLSALSVGIQPTIERSAKATSLEKKQSSS